MNAIPKPITVNTGEQHEVSKTIEDFFRETKEFYEEHHQTKESDFSIRSRQLAYHGEQITDDRITYLAYRDMILSTVFETRTELNYVHYTFFRDLGE